ncbi:hypothetical protein [Neptunicella marina]|uniref:Uncharacterized protein n=1 Tax=Neptunicella marina TaxID=2125989 RepID=A0A8J6ISB1_9ALTE|nr:hypothetical protein [Neptunicella marina]MBC3764681.1 hypothetical protein [Neptunicella marina]
MLLIIKRFYLINADYASPALIFPLVYFTPADSQCEFGKRYNMNTLFSVRKTGMAIMLLLVTLLTQTGCMQSQSHAAAHGDVPSTLVPANTLKIVNGVFYTSLTRGNWYYKGARAFNGTINAYIEIPAEVSMDKALLKSYLQTSICPGADKKLLWQQLQNITLKVHLYTEGNSRGIRTQCLNPLV